MAKNMLTHESEMPHGKFFIASIAISLCQMVSSPAYSSADALQNVESAIRAWRAYAGAPDAEKASSEWRRRWEGTTLEISGRFDLAEGHVLDSGVYVRFRTSGANPIDCINIDPLSSTLNLVRSNQGAEFLISGTIHGVEPFIFRPYSLELRNCNISLASGHSENDVARLVELYRSFEINASNQGFTAMGITFSTLREAREHIDAAYD
jgi:hypothetical protein